MVVPAAGHPDRCQRLSAPVQYQVGEVLASIAMHKSCQPGFPVLLIVAAGSIGLSQPIAAAEPTTAAPSWRLSEGERVVLLGDTLFERDGQLGFLETALVMAFPDSDLEFRNLGWGGDTVWADSRGVFDPPAKGYARMLTLVGELAPDVIFVAYGRNESFAGERKLSDFQRQLTKLCDDLRAAAAGEHGGKPRLVLVTPSPFEQQPTCPDAASRNAVLSHYAAAIRETAAAAGAGLVDLFGNWPTGPQQGRFTTDGMHLSAAGYQTAAKLVVAAADRHLPADWTARFEPVRERVNAKNRLFFHRWRPANETYLFLFRKHEQGNNAVEIPQFDPLVAEAEAAVRTARDTLTSPGQSQ